MTKTIAIRSDGPYTEDHPLEDRYYMGAYLDLNEEIEKRGGTVYMTKDDKYYLGGNRFARGWKLSGRTYTDIREPFEVDVIFRKDSGFVPTADAFVINTKEFDDMCTDKANVYRMFPNLCPLTFTVHTPEEIDEALKKIPSQLVVVKPLSAYGGQGVFIGKKEEARPHITQFPYLIQEFIDSSHGIPGITTRVHDYRMVIMNGEVVYTFIRTPAKKEGLISNLSLGGWMTPVKKELRPKGALALCSEVDRAFSRFERRIYSVDCALNSDGVWKLIELNAPPGQQNRIECGDDADEYFRKHADVLLN
jgi:glutathione synthase/RimK-type ligase-like ATP-grasp enzyme